MCVVWSGSKRELSNKNKKGKNVFKIFCILGWWMKGKINAFICLGYGVMHATSEGGSNEY
jgi:hypothetical protein